MIEGSQMGDDDGLEAWKLLDDVSKPFEVKLTIKLS